MSDISRKADKYEQLKKNLKQFENQYDGIIGGTLGAARLAIIDLQESSTESEGEAAQLRKQNANLKAAWEEQNEEIRSLHTGYTSANAKLGEELYFWEPYAENHLESLTGGVVIRAEWLRQLIEEAKGESEGEAKRQWDDPVYLEGRMKHYELLALSNATKLDEARAENERLRAVVKQIANYQRDQYESPLNAYDECKRIARDSLSSHREDAGKEINNETTHD